ncbi:MAG: DNA-packaging protein [Bacteroides sp.]|nr:DNA-packaging protein [Bacteroides sp.]
MKRRVERQRRFKNPEQIQEAINAYFLKCDEEKKPYTIEGICVTLEIDRQTLLHYETKKEYELFFQTVKKAKIKVAENLVTRGLTGVSNSTLTVFLLKNNHHYEDKQELKVTDKYEIEF